MTALWLCLYLPALALDALGPWPPGVTLPTLVWEQAQGGRLVLVANAAARSLGVQAGQRLSTAQALAPGALVLPRQPEREADLLQRLALSLGALTPQLSLDGADLLLDIHASLRLFGGVRPLLRRARGLIQSCGVRASAGLASTPLAARLLARQPRRAPRHALQQQTTRRYLQALPLQRLLAVSLVQPVGPIHASSTTPLDLHGFEMLQALGVRSLGDLHQLPRAGLTRRGAGAWLAALERAEGHLPDPRRWFEPPLHFSLSLNLTHPADSLDGVAAATQHLLQALCGWLSLHWRAAQTLELRLKHEQGARRSLPDEQLRLDLATPSRELRHLSTLLHEHLQRLPLAAPIDALQLDLCASVPCAGQARSLLPDAHEQASEHAALIDRLRARLGADQVQRLQPQADPRPEKADRTIAPEAWPQRDDHAPNLSPIASHLMRPTWLLDPPRALDVAQDHPLHEGQPLRLLTRAERIEAGWHDGAPARRDYHVALGHDGVLRWIYREHTPPRDEPAPTRWFLHGLFA